jgi:hypothetical protein
MIRSPETMTAPTGTSPRSAALQASFKASPMNFSSSFIESSVRDQTSISDQFVKTGGLTLIKILLQYESMSQYPERSGHGEAGMRILR